MMNKKESKTIFHSFQEVAAFLGTSNKQQKKKISQEKKDKFTKRHLCPACHQPMTYCGGNIMVCMTKGCEGISHKTIDPVTKEERIWHTASYHILDDKGASIANYLLNDED